MITTYQAMTLPVREFLALAEAAPDALAVPVGCVRALARKALADIEARDQSIVELEAQINQLKGSSDGD